MADILIACLGDLTGMNEAISPVYPKHAIPTLYNLSNQK